MNFTYLAVLSTDNYLMGALVLYESLKRTQPKYPFAVLITKNISPSVEEILKKKGIRVIRIDDCMSNLNGSGSIKLLFTSWHNLSITNEELASKNIIRVNNWLDIANIVLTNEEID
jgi:5'(3')-deoxyribonucleotidase